MIMRRKAATAELLPEKSAELIAETAYYKAEGRGFAPGQELADWLAAEREVAAMLKKAAQPVRKKAVTKKKAASKKKVGRKKEAS
jgi:hypothetical protein